MVPWNDVEAFERAIAAHGDELAAVFCEPIHYNAGCIPPEPGFLELLRARCSEHGIVFVIDEVLSGFRTHLGGVQAQYGVTPGPDDARQGAGQRPAAGLRLRAGGPDAHSGPDRAGRPQRHLLRASAQRAGRAGHARGAAASPVSMTASTPRPTPSTATCRPSSTGQESPRGCRAWAPASASTSAAPSRCGPGRTRSATTTSSTAASPPAARARRLLPRLHRQGRPATPASRSPIRPSTSMPMLTAAEDVVGTMRA